MSLGDLAVPAFPSISIVSIVIAIIGLVAGVAILHFLGLLIAVIFFALALGILYLLKDVLDLEKNKFLILLPFGAGVLGWGLDKINVLDLSEGMYSVMEMQGFSFAGFDGVFPVGFVVLAVLICLLLAILIRWRRG